MIAKLCRQIIKNSLTYLHMLLKCLIKEIFILSLIKMLFLETQRLESKWILLIFLIQQIYLEFMFNQQKIVISTLNQDTRMEI